MPEVCSVRSYYYRAKTFLPPHPRLLSKTFHPNVGARGEIRANVFKRNWTAEVGIGHVLLSRCLLGHPNPESALKKVGAAWRTTKCRLPVVYPVHKQHQPLEG